VPTRYGPQLGLTHQDVQARRPITAELRAQLGPTDGCGFDQAGNLWVTLVLANKVVAITPQARWRPSCTIRPGVSCAIRPMSLGRCRPCATLYIGSVVSDYVIKVRQSDSRTALVHQR